MEHPLRPWHEINDGWFLALAVVSIPTPGLFRGVFFRAPLHGLYCCSRRAPSLFGIGRPPLPVSSNVNIRFFAPKEEAQYRGLRSRPERTITGKRARGVCLLSVSFVWPARSRSIGTNAPIIGKPPPHLRRRNQEEVSLQCRCCTIDKQKYGICGDTIGRISATSACDRRPL